MRSKSYLEQLYLNEHLSIREIARSTDASHSVVVEAMKRFDIPQNGNGHKHPGQIPFGYEYTDLHDHYTDRRKRYTDTFPPSHPLVQEDPG